MKKIVSIGILVLFAVLVTSQTDYSNYGYYVEDKVQGRNLEVEDFIEELGIIEQLIYNDMLKRSSNFFSATIGYGITPDWKEDIYNIDKLKFNGQMSFDDRSRIDYEITDFELIDTNVDEYGVTEAWGNANFTYRAVLVIEREIPVDAYFAFWQDVDDKDNFEQLIDIQGEGIDFILRNGERQRFSHRRRCYVGCEE